MILKNKQINRSCYAAAETLPEPLFVSYEAFIILFYLSDPISCTYSKYLRHAVSIASLNVPSSSLPSWLCSYCYCCPKCFTSESLQGSLVLTLRASGVISSGTSSLTSLSFPSWPLYFWYLYMYMYHTHMCFLVYSCLPSWECDHRFITNIPDM